VIGIPATGSRYYRYDKHHLVPYGEFIPRLPLVRQPDVDPAGRPDQRPRHPAGVPVKDQRVLPNICYEDLFGEEIAGQLNHPAQARNRPPCC
jgi:apolipoprotein N-acyltransferase